MIPLITPASIMTTDGKTLNLIPDSFVVRLVITFQDGSQLVLEGQDCIETAVRSLTNFGRFVACLGGIPIFNDERLRDPMSWAQAVTSVEVTTAAGVSGLYLLLVGSGWGHSIHHRFDPLDEHHQRMASFIIDEEKLRNYLAALIKGNSNEVLARLAS